MQITYFLKVFEVCNEDNKGYLSREDSTVGLVSFLPETLKGIYFFHVLKIQLIDVSLLRTLVYTNWSGLL